MVGMFVCVCLASGKPSEQEFFVSAGTHLGVKLLQTFPIFVLSQHLIARNVCELFSFYHGISHFKEACYIDELS